jgi:hypothetical protein
VHDAGFVGGTQGREGLAEDVGGATDGERSVPAQDGGEWLALQELHHDVGGAGRG